MHNFNRYPPGFREMSFKERSRAWGNPETMDDYFEHYSRRRKYVVWSCIVVIFVGFFSHMSIAYLLYLRDRAYAQDMGLLNTSSMQFIQGTKIPDPKSFKDDEEHESREYFESRYSEEGIKQLMERDDKKRNMRRLNQGIDI